MRKRFVLLSLVWGCLMPLSRAQEYHGTTGLLHVPSAETAPAGTFHGGASFLHKAFMPDMSFYGEGMPFNTACYTVGITAFTWLELSYTGVLVRYRKERGNLNEPMRYYNEDRHVNMKLRPLKEGRWWPAVALGWDDLGRLSFLKAKNFTTNNFFDCQWVMMSKHIDLRHHELGLHVGYRYYYNEKNAERRGVAGGVTYVPNLGEVFQEQRAWLQRPRCIFEWDGSGVNVGADVLLWRHLFIQAALVHGRGFTGGVAYHYTIPH